MLSGARGFQILARRLGVELSQAQFNDIKDIDKKELDFDTLRKLSYRAIYTLYQHSEPKFLKSF